LEPKALDREADPVLGGSKCERHFVLRSGPFGGEQQLYIRDADRLLPAGATIPTQTLADALAREP
jgi:hypothetical protein